MSNNFKKLLEQELNELTARNKKTSSHPDLHKKALNKTKKLGDKVLQQMVMKMNPKKLTPAEIDELEYIIEPFQDI